MKLYAFKLKPNDSGHPKPFMSKYMSLFCLRNENKINMHDITLMNLKKTITYYLKFHIFSCILHRVKLIWLIIYLWFNLLAINVIIFKTKSLNNFYKKSHVYRNTPHTYIKTFLYVFPRCLMIY